MNSNWKKTSLEEIASDEKTAIAIGPFGSRMKSDCYVKNGIPVIMGNNISEGKYPEGNFVFVDNEKANELKSAQVFGGDLVFPHRGAIGKVALIEESNHMILSSSLMKFSPNKDKCSSEFLLYFFRSKIGQYELLKNASTVGTPGIGQPLSSLKSIEINLPPLKEQQAIANILSTLDEKIKINKKNNEILEEIAKRVFKSWFIDFEPVKKKEKGLSSELPDEINDLFPSNLENKDFAPIPQGWTWRRLGDFISLDKGVSYKGEFLSDSEGLPMINLGCFAGYGRFREDKMKFYSGKHNEQHIANSGDILIANTDITQDRIILGSPIIMPKWKIHQKFLFSHHVYILRLNEGKRDWSGFIFQSLLRTKFRHIAIGYATGTTVLALPKDGIMEYLITVPPQKLVTCYEKYFKNLYSRMENNSSQNLILNELRNTLLPKLISGKLRIPDAEKIIEEV